MSRLEYCLNVVSSAMGMLANELDQRADATEANKRDLVVLRNQFSKYKLQLRPLTEKDSSQ